MSEANSVDVLNGVLHLNLIYPTRCMITVDGSIRVFDEPVSIEQGHELLRAGSLDTVILEDRKHVMLVDDLGSDKHLPVNALATRHYHAKCGAVVPWSIRGPVLIVPDADYIKDEALRGMYD